MEKIENIIGRDEAKACARVSWSCFRATTSVTGPLRTSC